MLKKWKSQSTTPLKFLRLNIYDVLYVLLQCFPNRSWRTPSPAHFVSLPYQTHPNHVLQSLLMSWWVESGVLDKGDTQNVQGYGSSRTGLGSTVLLWIKYWHMWFESLLVFILFKFKKMSQHFRNSGCTKLIAKYQWTALVFIHNIPGQHRQH